MNASEPVHIISLGAGVQSSAPALMAAAGDITPMPFAAIFADTQDEPYDVYAWLSWLEKQLPFPVNRVTAGKLSDSFDRPHSHMPLFSKRPDGTIGMGRRQCTKYFKVLPMYRFIRQKLRIKRATIWIGISLDEVIRMKPARPKWATNIWPLIEKRMNRNDCLAWLKHHGFPPAHKSTCVFCPLRSDVVLRKLKSVPNEWERIVEVGKHFESRGEFLHPSCRPISEVDFSSEEERGQINMFGNECEGMCGV